MSRVYPGALYASFLDGTRNEVIILVERSKQTRRPWFWFWVLVVAVAAWFLARFPNRTPKRSACCDPCISSLTT
jgi:hypothetical protein